MDGLDLDPQRAGQRREPAAALKRGEPARERDRADHRRRGPFQRGAGEGLAEHAHVERRVVGDQHAAAQQPAQLRQHVLGRGRRVEHRLRDAGEALDPAPERVRDADQRVPLVMELAAAHEHRPDLGQLAAFARQTVGLGVEGDELRGGEGLLEHGPHSIRPRPDAATALAFAPCTTVRDVRRSVPLIAVLALAGCGGSEQRENELRPAVPVTLTGAIHSDGVLISPAAVGAGQITLVVSNQSGAPQKVTFETDEIGGRTAGQQASSPLIPPRRTGRLTIKATPGVYSVHVADDAIRPARVLVGPPRKSGQNRVLLP